MAAAREEPSESAVVSTVRHKLARKGSDPVVLELPKIGLGNAAIARKVNELFSPESVLGQSLVEAAQDAKQEPRFGVQAARYRVGFNRHGILDVTVTVDTMGAYPSGSRYHAVVDLRSGVRVDAPRAFRASARAALTERLDAMLAAEVKRAVEANKALQLEPAEEAWFRSALAPARFQESMLDDFEVSDAGVTFVYDYAFPHAALALKPPGELRLSWAEIAPFLDPSGPLARVPTS